MRMMFKKRLTPEGVRAFYGEQSNAIYFVGDNSVIFTEKFQKLVSKLEDKGYLVFTTKGDKLEEMSMIETFYPEEVVI